MRNWPENYVRKALNILRLEAKDEAESVRKDITKAVKLISKGSEDQILEGLKILKPLTRKK